MDNLSTHKTGNLRFYLDFIRNSAVVVANAYPGISTTIFYLIWILRFFGFSS